jgi:hypothetical protein
MESLGDTAVIRASTTLSVSDENGIDDLSAIQAMPSGELELVLVVPKVTKPIQHHETFAPLADHAYLQRFDRSVNFGLKKIFSPVR